LADVMTAKPTFQMGKLLHVISRAMAFQKSGALFAYYCDVMHLYIYAYS
jgi:hypothetical protein